MNNSLLLNRLRQTNHPKSRKLGILFAASPLKSRSYSCNNALEIAITVISLHDPFHGGSDLLGLLQGTGVDTLLELLQLLACPCHRLLALRPLVGTPFVGVDDDHAHVGDPGRDFLGVGAWWIGFSFQGIDTAGTVDPL